MTNAGSTLSGEHQAALLKLAAASIEHGLRHNKSLPAKTEAYPPELKIPRAVFVTLTIADELRGCVGTLETKSSLIENVSKYAYAAAFSDSRFPPLRSSEFPNLNIQISILSDLEPVAFGSETDLLEKIRPGIDGLLLEDGVYRGTFLPSVWEDVPERRDFLRRLKQKAGLPSDYWSETIRIYRYTTTCVA